MESEEDKDLFPIARGKRTKRFVIHSPIAFTTEPPSIGDHNATTISDKCHHPISPVSVSSEESTTTGVEDTARCLILLAQGHSSGHPKNDNPAITTVHGGLGDKAKGACMYACKTCNRAFRSFQALGGHRASHRKLKNERKVASSPNGDDFPSPPFSSSKKRMPSNYLSLQLNNISTTPEYFSTLKSAPSPRIHMCMHCGAEFTSGQALGGHMRRHRGGLVSPSSKPTAACLYIEEHHEEIEHENEELMKPGNGLSLDLNLPAPEQLVDRNY